MVVTASRSAAAEQGIDPARLLEARPECVVVTISDFGWTGPWSERPANEFTLQADSGLTGFRGDPAGPPISVGGELGEYMGGGMGRIRRDGAAPSGLRAAAPVGTSTCPCSRRSR